MAKKKARKTAALGTKKRTTRSPARQPNKAKRPRAKRARPKRSPGTNTSIAAQSGAGHLVIQIELKDPVRAIPAKAQSDSPFRFASLDGKRPKQLHETLRTYSLHTAHSSFRMNHPRQHRRRTQEEKNHLSRFVNLIFPQGADIPTLLRDLRALPEVLQAMEVRPTRPAAFPKDPLIGTDDQARKDSDTGNYLQWYLFRCRVDRAWQHASGQGVVIADVDAGFVLEHHDLAPNVETDHTFNAVDGTNDVTAGDLDHGTGVLGIAIAASNGEGIAGVAFSAKAWPIEADAGNGPPLPGDPVANAIDWVTGENRGGRRVVINIEHQTHEGGNCEQCPSIGAAIRKAIEKGFVVCVAAGNGDRDAGLADDGTEIQPTGAILVGATAYDPVQNPRAASGTESSNWGARISVSAPGDGSNDVTCATTTLDWYRSDFGGTSSASAKVAGVVALMLEVNPALSHDQVKSILISTGSALPTDKPIGVFLNAEAAVTAALQKKMR